MKIRKYKFCILKSNFSKVCEVAKRAIENEELQIYSEGDKKTVLCMMEKNNRYVDVLFTCLGMGWGVHHNEKTRNIDGFEWYPQDIGNGPGYLFHFIAPFVKNGSYFELENNKGIIFRLCFENKTVVIKKAKIIFE